jgi:hypothetical protein
VVLGGGLLRAGLVLLDDAVKGTIVSHAPRARVLIVDREPIVGAGLLALAVREGRRWRGSAARARAALR